MGSDHFELAHLLSNLALLYTEQRLYTRAEPLHERVLQIREATLGDNHPDVASSLSNLAALYKAQELYSRAEPLLVRAWKIYEAALGDNHPDVATALNNLASLYTAQRLYSRAEPLLVRALQIREAALGDNHPEVILSLSHLACLHLAQEQFDVALPLLWRALTCSEKHLRQQIHGFSEQSLALFFRLLRRQEGILYSLARARPDEPGVLGLALAAALLRQGRSVQEIQANREAFERLGGPRTELPLPDQIIARVRSALPGDGALIEFVFYDDRPLGAECGLPRSQAPEHPRYLAFVLLADERTHCFDLGPAGPLDIAAQSLHRSLEGSVSHLPAAREFHALTFSALRPHLGKARRLFIVPDGQLNLVRFDALHDGDAFLAELFDITYLTSGRDMLPRR